MGIIKILVTYLAALLLATNFAGILLLLLRLIPNWQQFFAGQKYRTTAIIGIVWFFGNLIAVAWIVFIFRAMVVDGAGYAVILFDAMFIFNAVARINKIRNGHSAVITWIILTGGKIEDYDKRFDYIKEFVGLAGGILGIFIGAIIFLWK